jgi:hypothetical protein
MNLFAIFKRILIGALLLVATPAPAAGHGYLAQPPARNVIYNSNYCPQCLNAGGPWKVFGDQPVARYGVCGDAIDEPKDHESGGKYGSTNHAVFKRFDAFVAKVTLTANHLGRWSLRLCRRRPDDSSTPETQRCFDAHVLRRVDGSGPFTYVLPGVDTYEVWYRLPRRVVCEHCVLQWFYETGNSCTPPGTPPGFANSQLGVCFAPGTWVYPEQFWNCADVRINFRTKSL